MFHSASLIPSIAPFFFSDRCTGLGGELRLPFAMFHLRAILYEKAITIIWFECVDRTCSHIA